MRGRRRRVVAGLGATAVVAASLVAVAASPASAAAGCQVAYTTNDWPGGFTANVAITNLGDPLSSWDLEFDFPDSSQQITQAWSSTYTQSGQHVTLSNMAWNGSLGTNASVNPGFNGSWSSSNPAPTSFTLNGVACTGQTTGDNTAPTVSITSPAANATFTAPATIPIMASASDPDAGDSITKVEFYRDGILAGTSTTAPYSYTLTAVPVGDYSLVAKAYDSAGAVGTSAAVPVSVLVTTDPHVVTSAASVTVPEGGTATFAIALSSAPTASTTVTVARTAGDSDITVSAGSSRTFTTSNWSTAQTVTLAAAEDEDTTSDSATITATTAGYELATINAIESDNDAAGGTYVQEFTELYNKIHDPANGYFSPEGVPYHSIETLMVEAPDHGHETTSEAFSYYLWLEANHGRITEDWAPFNAAWDVMETYVIPNGTDYPQNSGYDPSSPATYAPEFDQPSSYPTPMDSSVTPGSDPLYNELSSTYGTNDIYGMHWLLDVDNVYGYGKCGDGTTTPAYINTYQRGPQESVWETVAHPSCETFDYGSENGYLPIFIQDEQYAQQWRFTNAPDADARAVQVAYWALTWATEQGKASEVAATIDKAAKMGDYLRYAMYDKYFKQPGCTSPDCAAGTGKDASAYLLSWYYAWGGALDGSWSWRIGSSHNHGGYQNPFAAWALSTVSELTPQSPTAQADWATSLDRQVDFMTWLQSSEGAIAGGATNSWEGAYGAPPAGTPTFYGMAYDEKPVYHDPPSNQWFGFQAWGVERLAEYYYATGDARAEAILDKWVSWALENTTVGSGGDFQIPSTLSWTGQPGGDWADGTTSVDNSGLHVSVVDHTTDIGVAGSYAHLLTYYGVKANNTEALTAAKGLLDGILAHKDTQGVSVEETREDYDRFDDIWSSGDEQGLYIPSGFSGTMPNGDEIAAGKSFLDIRSFYQDDPDWSKVQAYLDGGAAPTFNYHRFWAQTDVAVALADYGMLVGS
ncbi:MAG: cellulose 1,4-beta-cellobiosidase [Dactylosporangium sp.]|nr:cellulose binding domain-containing protein [Dactylosporangium sp.]NNJ60260.1 cellulose 1,4-beta-cellobiosidase [Dactylosporangium sp.]